MKTRITPPALSFVIGAILLAAPPALASTALYDPSIQHHPKDGVVKLYGAGGPHTAFKKVADAFTAKTGIAVDIIAGPETKWSADAQQDADILWGTSEQSMTAFLETYKTFSSETVEPIYTRPSVIAVKKGNPKGITGIGDLTRPGMRIVVTEGAGVYNTSGTGVWEDVIGRTGDLHAVRAFRQNIVAFAKGSGASYKAFREQDADAWITWPNWPLTHTDVADMIEIDPDHRIWRDVNMALSPDADSEATRFLSFLKSEDGAELMKTEGWIR
ncbi:MAG: substrate-binding domain-containing protein [Rhodospirillum sp.]|nr:substrate-binding domain-containing protein [Rhodospirillum sp.]MCF8490735.1 substrate-binding domain-containing protein [Rhodospirillum sp.]MCF8501909.1 substrate-binding domain-containing protein [Rhodospirillum sp.]